MPRPPHIHVNQITAALTAANLLVDVRGELPNTVTSVEDDSRRVTAGGLFIAVRGSERDGHDFLECAAVGRDGRVIKDDDRHLRELRDEELRRREEE